MHPRKIYPVHLSGQRSAPPRGIPRGGHMRGKKEIRLHEALGTARKQSRCRRRGGCPVACVLLQRLVLTNCKTIVSSARGFVKEKMEKSRAALKRNTKTPVGLRLKMAAGQRGKPEAGVRKSWRTGGSDRPVRQ